MQRIAVLDFDGVLCDSARETAATAWRGGSAIWPSWTGDIPAHHLERFAQVRPWLETGYQAILMMRMVDLGCDDTDFSERLHEWERRIMTEAGCSKERLVELFGGTRDQWIEQDLSGWLARNRFFPGTIERVKACIAEDCELYIATTKQERFVKALLEFVGLHIPAEHLYGLDRGLKKEQLLASLLADHQGVPLHFVEDRLETLQRVQAMSELDAVELYLATWGYCTLADKQTASTDPRITSWTLEDFLWKPV